MSQAQKKAKGIKATKKWADVPFELLETPRKRLGISDPKKASGAVNAATEMALIHNVIIRSLNCIYLQAPNVKSEQDIADFTTFMHAWSITIHEHHGNEEKFFFPWLEEDIGIENYLEKNVEQHDAFAPGMKLFDEYIAAMKAGKERYNSSRVLEIIDDFGPILQHHLVEEIESLEELERFGDKIDWKRWNKRMRDHGIKTSDKSHEIPLVITNADQTFEKTLHFWPPIPWFAGYILRWVFLPRYKGAWRFSSCDWYGMPKELEFV